MIYTFEYIVEKAMFDYDPEGANQLKSFIGKGINVYSDYAFLMYQASHIKFVTDRGGKKRFRKIPTLIAGHFSEWRQEYKDLIPSFQKNAKEQNCDPTDLGFSDFPEIVW